MPTRKLSEGMRLTEDQVVNRLAAHAGFGWAMDDGQRRARNALSAHYEGRPLSRFTKALSDVGVVYRDGEFYTTEEEDR